MICFRSCGLGFGIVSFAAFHIILPIVGQAGQVGLESTLLPLDQTLSSIESLPAQNLENVTEPSNSSIVTMVGSPYQPVGLNTNVEGKPKTSFKILPKDPNTITAEELARNKTAWAEATKFLNGSKIKVVAVIEPPFVNYLNLTKDPDKKYGPGVIMNILNEIGTKYSIEFELVPSIDGTWGAEDKTGNWSGMIGMLQRKEVDMLAGAAIVRFDRYTVIDYTVPFTDSLTGMLIRSPEAFIDNAWLIVTKPFEWKVWVLIAVSILVSGLILSALTRALKAATEVQYDFIGSIWVFFSVFVQQGLPVQPKSWTCRTMLAFWWLGALTLVATFTGNMVALFAVEKTIMPISSPEGLLSKIEQGYMSIMSNTSMTRTLFLQNSKISLYQKMWRYMSTGRQLKYVVNLTDGVQDVINKPNQVLLAGKESLEVIAAANCKVTVTDSGIIPVYYALCLTKDSKYKHIFDKEIRELVEMGFIAKWHNDYRYYLAAERGNQCVYKPGVSARGTAIDLEESQGAFRILGYGVMFGFSGFILEEVLKIIRWILRKLGIISEPEKVRHGPPKGSQTHANGAANGYAQNYGGTYGMDYIKGDGTQNGLGINGFIKHRKSTPGNEL